MIIPSSPQTVAIYAGLCMGAILGLYFITRTESLRRGAMLHPVDPFENVGFINAIGVIFLVSLKLLVVTVIMLSVGLGIMRMGGLQGLDGVTRVPFGLAFMTGAALSKFGRYLYWRIRSLGSERSLHVLQTRAILPVLWRVSRRPPCHLVVLRALRGEDFFFRRQPAPR
jgi:hypothetical protein